ncbi:MAG TPA: hypothetical protein VMT86_08255 [Bryobacteraceae bacterium]|nr:hypothetical protein [Bryobacteraceae bacterium]
MKVNRMIISGSVAAAMAILPVAGMAAERECVIGKPTPASYTWNFRAETDGIFAQMKNEAWQAREHAEQLQAFAGDAEPLQWQSHLNQLQQVRAAVNDMGEKLCRLESIRRVDSPWQRKEISRIARRVMLLADNTQDALQFGDTHRETLWEPAYQKYVDSIYSQALALTKSLDRAANYGKQHS